MNKGQPLELAALLPFGLNADAAMILLAALGMFMIIWSIGTMLIERDRFGPRLKMIQERRAELKGDITAARRRSKRPGAGETLSVIRRISTRLKLVQKHQTNHLQSKLTQAGFRSKDALMIFAFAQLVMPFIGLVVGLVLARIDWSKAFTLSELYGWMTLLSIVYASIRLPEFIVNRVRKKRYFSIRRALPDALDLMMICAEAGLSLPAALDRVGRELARTSPELAEELSLTSVELGFLPERSVALKNLGERVDIKEMRGLVNVIVQTEKYGTPIAQALRVLAREYRTERMLNAEQRAARLPAMMTVPMIVFILPTLFIIVMTPAIIGVMDTM